MCSKNTTKEESETVAKQTVLLDIPPRLQWDNGNGYCGETALQSIGILSYIFQYLFSLEYFVREQKMTVCFEYEKR
jgi:hypothetical protein